MQMSIEPGRTYDVVSPVELSNSLTAHHSSMVDSMVRAQLSGVKLINTRYQANNVIPYAFFVNAGFIFSPLFVSYAVVAGVTPAPVVVSIADDPSAIQPADAVGVAAAASPGFLNWAKGSVVAKDGQYLTIAPGTASSVAGIMVGIILPAEMIGKLYL